GLLDYITPNNWLTISSNKNLRKFILDNSNIKIVNFYAKVFESADVDSSIILFEKSQQNKSIELFEYTDNFYSIFETKTNYFLQQKDYIINIEAFKNTESLSLLEKIELQSIQLKTIADVKAGLQAYERGKGNPPQTEEIKENRVYHSTTKINDDYIKYLDGKDVCRYYLGWSGEYLKYGDNLASPRKDFSLFSTPRILVRQIPSPLPYSINACFTQEIILNDRNSMNIINLQENPMLILGIFNSKLISYWFAHKFGKLQRGIFPQFKVNELATFPIPNNFGNYKQPVIKLIDEILEKKEKDVKADVSEIDQQIDNLVYKLYELTYQEVKVIDPEFALTEQEYDAIKVE
ncbi:MAG: TaqI-like C-terminal specificity domain-containing protein, partial [Microcoleus sp.]